MPWHRTHVSCGCNRVFTSPVASVSGKLRVKATFFRNQSLGESLEPNKQRVYKKKKKKHFFTPSGRIWLIIFQTTIGWKEPTWKMRMTMKMLRSSSQSKYNNSEILASRVFYATSKKDQKKIYISKGSMSLLKSRQITLFHVLREYNVG